MRAKKESRGSVRLLVLCAAALFFCLTLLVREGALTLPGWESLAAFLLEEAAIEGTNELKITHEIIGSHMGHPREVVTRMLRYFQSEGLVKLQRGVVEITDEKRLRALSNE